MRGVAEWIRSHKADVSIMLFLLTALYGIIFNSLHQFNWGDEMLKIAENIAHHGSFSNPFAVLDTGPTAADPPLYPLMLAILIKLFRQQLFVSSAAAFGSVLTNAFTAVLLPRLSFIFFGDLLPGVIASLFWIAAMPLLPSWDTSYTVAGILLFCVVTAPLPDKKRIEYRSAVLGGVLAGLLFLLNPSSLLISITWVVFLLWRVRPGLSTLVRYSSIFLLLLSSFAAGWSARNYVQLGGWVVRTNLGMTLFASNNSCAEPSIIGNLLNGCYQKHHPNTSLAEATLLRDMGEIPFDRNRIAESKKWIEENPDRFRQLTIARIREFWFPAIENIPAAVVREQPDIAGWITQQNHRAYIFWVVTTLSIPGMILALQCREVFLIYALTVLSVYPLVYYVVVSDMRYRYPVLWISLLFAGYFLCHLGSLTPLAMNKLAVEKQETGSGVPAKDPVGRC